MVTNKTVKASLFTLILAFIVIGTVAIAGVMKKEKPVEISEIRTVSTTWHFTGGDPESPSSYSNNPVDAQSCEAPFETICTIEAPANGDEPNFTEIIDGKTVEQHVKDAMTGLRQNNPLPTNTVVTAYRKN